VRKFWAFWAGTILCLEACVPRARSVKSPLEEEALQSAPSSSPATEEMSSPHVTPLPPLSLQHDSKTSASTPPERRALEGGPEICLTAQPDLTRALISLRVRESMRPEERLLLKAWLQENWQKQLGGVVVDWSSPLCAGEFLCASVITADVVPASQAFLRALHTPSPQLFYSVRSKVLTQAEIDDHANIEWRLRTSAAALFTSLENRRAAQNHQKENAQAKKALEKSIRLASGSKFVSKITLTHLKKLFSRQLVTSQLLVTGPVPTKSTRKNLTTMWNQLPKRKHEPLSKKISPSSLSIESPQVPSRSLPLLHLEQDADEWSQAIVAWSTTSPLAEVALAILLQRWRVDTNSQQNHHVRAYLPPTREASAHQAIRIEGPFEQVKKAVLELDQEYAQLLSVRGKPDTNEVGRARLTLQALLSQTFASPCVNSVKGTPDALVVEEAIRKAGPPVAVIWGRLEKLEDEKL